MVSKPTGSTHSVDVNIAPTPRRIHRAGGLMSSNGRVVKELIDDDDARHRHPGIPSSYSPTTQRTNPFSLRFPTSNLKLPVANMGASIKRKFREVKDAASASARSSNSGLRGLGLTRSFSVNSHPVAVPGTDRVPIGIEGEQNGTGIERRKGHARNHSDVPIPTALKHTNSDPEPSTWRRRRSWGGRGKVKGNESVGNENAPIGGTNTNGLLDATGNGIGHVRTLSTIAESSTHHPAHLPLSSRQLQPMSSSPHPQLSQSSSHPQQSEHGPMVILPPDNVVLHDAPHTVSPESHPELGNPDDVQQASPTDIDASLPSFNPSPGLFSALSISNTSFESSNFIPKAASPDGNPTSFDITTASFNPSSSSNGIAEFTESVVTDGESSSSQGDVSVPMNLQIGTPMTKVTNKKRTKVVFRVDADLGQIVWEGKQKKIIPIENIKELRSGQDARYYREQFHLSPFYEPCWLTIIYILEGTYKTLHLIAPSPDIFRSWDTTLRKLHAIRQELMSGLGNLEMRQKLWEKQYWRDADEERDQRLVFEEVERLCVRLNINSGREELERLFRQADVKKLGYLDFSDFQRFVKLLKGRPEVNRIYRKLCGKYGPSASSSGKGSGAGLTFRVFEGFMKDHQKSTLTSDQLHSIFDKYATIPPTSPTPSSATFSSTWSDVTATSISSTSPQPIPSSTSPDASPPEPIFTIDSFTSFLFSADNSAFSDQHSRVWQDMTRPLSEYYISSSHNTYLVGHQLVGVSTVEGYIRALLHGCRSVELDIYDGDSEPMIFHGKTFTSKVSLREVCHAIKKYGFRTSPYPIIISAEVHCSVPQQDMIADIMIEVFEDALVRQPADGLLDTVGLISPGRIDKLPSPEDLKGRILFKTKNLHLLRRDSMDSDMSFTDPSSTSDSDVFFEVSPKKRRGSQSDAKDKGLDPRPSLLQRVRSVGKSTSRKAISTPTPARSLPNSPATIKTGGMMGRRSSDAPQMQKPKMSMALIALLVYTVGVKCRGINKKEEYAPEHMFSLSENAVNKLIRTGTGMQDLIKHCRTHLVRIYPKGLRLNSTNYEPHRFWSAGAQLVALNWQTFDLGYMINHAMFQRNGRAGWVLKPRVLRLPQQKELLFKRTSHILEVVVISAQQLPRPKDASGHEIFDKSAADPYVEVSIHVPDWPQAASLQPAAAGDGAAPNSLPPLSAAASATAAKTLSYRTSVVKNNGFNPVWEERLQIPFDCVGDMKELIFVRFVVRQEDKEDGEPLAVYCASLGCLEQGYRHLPLHDSQLSQYLFSTLFVNINIRDI
ncbi:hypothetical protein BDQ12DRAFT_683948 [Crucibulum laeve]|uniref:Phosphoinositide phospholipase C n=1 Tax=Crucibulum laeve TaxID=68775 RepID=A0A5C3LYZ7_9AGAR|nr:hypothetical protein BDQ12DRAFT_683948 [Crucibulum laeve]